MRVDNIQNVTGFSSRRSEVLGLKWGAIDFKRDTIVVNHTVVIANHKVTAQDSAKTRSSYRTLPLTVDIKLFSSANGMAEQLSKALAGTNSCEPA